MALPQKSVKLPLGVAQKRQQPLAKSGFSVTTHRPPGRIAARSVGAFMPKLTRTAFEKFGFSTAQLLTDWAQIVGPQLAATTSPDRIKWPRAPGQDAGDREGSGPRAGATLHLRVDPSRALDVQYKASLIIDRINGYFGYRAVADIRIVQAVTAGGPHPIAPRPPAVPVVPEPAIAAITDSGLRAALERMQSGLAARRR